MIPGREFLEEIGSKVKPFISPLDLLAGESTCPQVDLEAPEIYMTQPIPKQVSI